MLENIFLVAENNTGNLRKKIHFILSFYVFVALKGNRKELKSTGFEFFWIYFWKNI